MIFEATELKEMEKQATELRKKVIIYKMEEYYEYAGIQGGDCFMEYLKENIGFKYGNVIDFENFKKDFLTDTFRLTEFCNKFVNSALDYDSFVYLGFDNDIEVVDVTEVYETYYRQIMDYEFSNEDLTLFEDFVDFKYNKCFN